MVFSLPSLWNFLKFTDIVREYLNYKVFLVQFQYFAYNLRYSLLKVQNNTLTLYSDCIPLMNDFDDRDEDEESDYEEEYRVKVRNKLVQRI